MYIRLSGSASPPVATPYTVPPSFPQRFPTVYIIYCTTFVYIYMRCSIVFWVIKGGHKFYDFYGRITVIIHRTYLCTQVGAATTNILSKSTRIPPSTWYVYNMYMSSDYIKQRREVRVISRVCICIYIYPIHTNRSPFPAQPSTVSQRQTRVRKEFNCRRLDVYWWPQNSKKTV